MVTSQVISKRPMCISCSKPVRLCLCTRIRTPELHNSVSVSILQHSLEKNHPLNSARIARIGLKNLDVVSVSDVHFEARFIVRLQDPSSQTGSDRNGSKISAFDQVGESIETQNLVSECCDEASLGKESPELEHKFTSEMFTNDKHFDGKYIADEVSIATALGSVSNLCNVGFDSVEGVRGGDGEPVITATIGKYGSISFLSHIWMPQIDCKNKKFDAIMDISVARDALADGFVVRKLQMRPLEGNVGLDEHVEFEIEVPPGSVLLFPSEKAVGAADLEAMDFEVKNLIVLDGTWAKAKRMYGENPWLKLLPHLKLDLDKMSLYNGVRLQPKPGFLSTIESIVYALQAVGESPEGLDNLLDVFKSMVEDQVRCKQERLSHVSPG